MPDLRLILRMDRTLHTLFQKNIKKKNIPESFEKQNGFPQTEYKAQNDRIGKIYRFSMVG